MSTKVKPNAAMRECYAVMTPDAQHAFKQLTGTTMPTLIERLDTLNAKREAEQLDEREEAEAERLVALANAAPKMLEALKAALKEMLEMNTQLRHYGKGRHEDGAHPDCAFDQVTQAIAAAGQV